MISVQYYPLDRVTRLHHKLVRDYRIGSECPRTTMFNMYYNGMKRMLRDGCAGIPNLSRDYKITMDGEKDAHLSQIREIW